MTLLQVSVISLLLCIRAKMSDPVAVVYLPPASIQIAPAGPVLMESVIIEIRSLQNSLQLDE